MFGGGAGAKLVNNKMSVNEEPCRGSHPSPAPVYFTLNLLSELPSHETLNLRYNQPRPPLQQQQQQQQHKQDSALSRRCCVLVVEGICLLPLILCLCGIVLLPSAVYFIPREQFNLFSNSSSNNSSLAASIIEESNYSIASVDKNCTQGFFHDPNGTVSNGCRPSCEDVTLERASVRGFSVYRLVVMAAAALSCFSALCFLGLFTTLKRKTLFSFPRIYSFYKALSAASIAIVFLIGSVQSGFFCSTEDFITSSSEETVFCTISGIFFSYICLQLMMLTAFHSVAVLVFGGGKLAQDAGRSKIFHSVSVVIAVVVPIVSSLVQLLEGFEAIGVPVVLCIGRNKDYVYGAFSLPMSLLGVISTVALVIAGWKLLKSCCKTAKYVEEGVENLQETALSRVVKFKTLLVITYTIMLGLAITSFLMYHFIYNEVMSQELTDYFDCKRDGLQNCSVLARHVENFQRLLIASVVALVLLPLVILLFNIELCGKSCGDCCGGGCTGSNSTGSHCSVHSFADITVHT